MSLNVDLCKELVVETEGREMPTRGILQIYLKQMKWHVQRKAITATILKEGLQGSITKLVFSKSSIQYSDTNILLELKIYFYKIFIYTEGVS